MAQAMLGSAKTPSVFDQAWVWKTLPSWMRCSTTLIGGLIRHLQRMVFTPKRGAKRRHARQRHWSGAGCGAKPCRRADQGCASERASSGGAPSSTVEHEKRAGTRRPPPDRLSRGRPSGRLRLGRSRCGTERWGLRRASTLPRSSRGRRGRRRLRRRRGRRR